MRSKKIALVHDWLTKFGGAERVLLVLAEIFPEAPIFTLVADPKITDKYFAGKKIISSPVSSWPEFIKKRQKWLLPFLPVAIEALNLSDYDIIISDSNSFAHGVITRSDAIHICYCHSPMRYAWDWKNEYQEENRLRGLKKIIVSAMLSKIRIWDYFASFRVDRWLANSQNAANRVQKYYHAQAEVIYPPIDLNDYKVSPAREDYFIIISRLEPYKKIDLAITAFNHLNLPLIIIGTGSDERRLKKMAKSNIKFLGFVSDVMMREYLALSRALIFPGEEDFGIVPIEAMASGVPVIALARGGVLETVREGESGIFFEKPTANALIFAIKKFIEKENRFDPQAIRASVKKFDKEIFIKKIKEIVDL